MNAYEIMTATEKQQVKHLFCRIVAQNGIMTYAEAQYEWENFILRNGVMLSDEFYMLRQLRVGATVRINRGQRQQIMLSVQNAVNHVAWENYNFELDTFEQ